MKWLAGLSGTLAVMAFAACDVDKSDGENIEADVEDNDSPEDGDGKSDAREDEDNEDNEDDEDNAAPEEDEGETGDPGAEEEPPCDEHEAVMECTDNGKPGLRYCDLTYGDWGPCVRWPECELGATCVEDGFECLLDDGRPTLWECENEEEGGTTPLVISFDGREPTFDAAAATFELSAGDGECLAREMPGADTPWLALDRDGSGTIDDGRELFGSSTPMPDGSTAIDGFQALSQYDDDGDGRITARDSVWPSLLLWSDYDGDRASSAVELVPVAYSGMTEIELEFRSERRCDGRGNCGIERGTFAFTAGSNDAPRTGAVIDVHIPCD